MKNKSKTYSDSKQTMWEAWFIASIVILFAYLIVGTMLHSVEQFPNWYIFAGLAVLNLLVCLYRGTRIDKKL